MELEQELNTFLASDEKTFLLRGRWGVGKTTAVKNWIDSIQSEQINWKPVWLSLFGVSDINELNKRLIQESSLLGKLGKYSSKLAIKVGGEYYAGLSFSLGRLFEIMAEKNMQKEQKKRKWSNKKKITKYLIILDDIERKDIKLSLDEIFGFIDQINPNKSKIIAITNSFCFRNDFDFRSFKEKVFDHEFFLGRPSLALKKYLFGNDRLFDRLNVDEIDNLRTILRCRKFVELTGIKADSMGLLRLAAVIKAIDSIDNNKFGEKDARQKYLEKEEFAAKYSSSREPFDKEKELQKYLSSHKGLAEADYFAEYFESEELFESIANRKDFLLETYQLVDCIKPVSIKKINIQLLASPYPKMRLALKLDEFRSGNAEYINKTLDEIDQAVGTEIEEASLFYELCKTGYYLSLSSPNNEIALKFEKISNKTIRYLSKRMIEAEYWWGDKLGTFDLEGSVGPEKAYGPYLESLKKTVVIEALEHFSTIDSFTNGEKANRILAIFHFANYDPNTNVAEFTDYIEKMFRSYAYGSLQENESRLRNAFDFLYDTKFDTAKIKKIIDKILNGDVPNKIQEQLNSFKKAYFG